MIVLDENLPDSQRRVLRSWRIRVQQIGHELGRPGMRDAEVVPFLRRFRRLTFFTRDDSFYQPTHRHAGYCLVLLAVAEDDASSFIRRVLRHPALNTLHAAIRYATNQRAARERFLADARLPIHNNISELHLRRQAIGRKNFLFVGSEDGGHVNTVFVSLLASCAMHRIEPWAYLRDLLCLLPSWPIQQVLDLAPVNWQATSERPKVQVTLSANIYRAATLTDAPPATA